MNLGMIGLGKMGSNMARRLMRGGHSCAVYDIDPANVREMEREDALPCFSINELIKSQKTPRILWVMVPSGQATESIITELKEKLDAGDLVVDGGNSHFKDGVRRSKSLAEKGIQFMDVGTSGGIWGLERGYCMMIGGSDENFRKLDPILSTLAPGSALVPKTPGRESSSTSEKGYLHCGPVGAGHFVKMVHNGVEYGLMQAFAEGFDILQGSNTPSLPADHRYELKLNEIAEVWRRGSVISAWLLDLLAIAMNKDPKLSKFEGDVADSGEGRWTLEAAIEEAVPANVIAASLFARFRSRTEHTFGEKALSAMRNEFGGHLEKVGPHDERKIK
jgi:6-phosphogluconate dehydrogenase